MKRLTSAQILESMLRHFIVPLCNHESIEISCALISALYDGGVRIFEFTNRSPNAAKVFAALVEHRNRNLPEMILGVGTVMTVEQVALFAEIGAQFIVAPVINEKVGDSCASRDLLWCPGATTLNEMVKAQDSGAKLVKLFPANYAGGPGYLKALRAACPDLKVLVSGGVEPTVESLVAWRTAGASCVGLGSSLFSNSPQRISEIVKVLVASISMD